MTLTVMPVELSMIRDRNETGVPLTATGDLITHLKNGGNMNE